MVEECFILTTGGTIDKVYFDAKSSFSVGDPQIGEVLRQAQVNLTFKVVSLMKKDSLELTPEDRESIRKTILEVPQRMVVVTHGTDTMTETALFIGTIPGKTIVLTGSLQPARFRENDAIFNIGLALGAVQSLPAGIYIAMNGRVFDGNRVVKNRAKNRFEALD